jgi:hypothetical protein
VLANPAEAEPRAIALGIAGLLEPSLVPPHRLSSPLPGRDAPLPIDSVIGILADDSVSALLTPGLRRFLSPDDRREWRDLRTGVPAWTQLGCDAAAAPVDVLGAATARWCYARGRGPEGGVAAILWLTADGHLAYADSYRY